MKSFVFSRSVLKKPTARLRELGIVLPDSKQPVGIYVNVCVVGNRLLFSGHGPWVNGKPITGKLGENVSISEGQQAAYQVGLGILASIVGEGVELDRLSLIKAFGMV